MEQQIIVEPAADAEKTTLLAELAGVNPVESSEIDSAAISSSMRINDVDELDDQMDVFMSLERNLSGVVGDGKALSVEAARIADITMASVISKLGIRRRNPIVSVEAFQSKHTRHQATSIALEDIGEWLLEMWEKLKKFLATMWKAIVDFGRKIKSYFTGSKKTLDETKDELEKLKKDPKVGNKKVTLKDTTYTAIANLEDAKKALTMSSALSEKVDQLIAETSQRSAQLEEMLNRSKDYVFDFDTEAKFIIDLVHKHCEHVSKTTEGDLDLYDGVFGKEFNGTEHRLHVEINPTTKTTHFSFQVISDITPVKNSPQTSVVDLIEVCDYAAKTLAYLEKEATNESVMAKNNAIVERVIDKNIADIKSGHSGEGSSQLAKIMKDMLHVNANSIQASSLCEYKVIKTIERGVADAKKDIMDNQ